MPDLRSGTMAVPKTFRTMLEKIGKQSNIKDNRDILKRTLIEEEKRRKTEEEDDLIKFFKDKSKDDNLLSKLPKEYQQTLNTTIDAEYPHACPPQDWPHGGQS